MRPKQDERVTSGYRVWITTCPSQWKPARWNDVPPDAVALRPLGDDLFTEERAANLVWGFNRVMLRGERRVWAVAVPAKLRIDDNLQPGLDASGAAVKLGPASRRGPAR